MFKTKRLVIKKLTEKYLEDLRQLRNDPSVNVFLTTDTYITPKMQTGWFRKLKHDKNRLYLSIHLRDNVFIGIIRSDEWDIVNRSVRIGLDIKKKCRRQGYATEAYRVFLRYLFSDLNMHRVWLEVLDNNTAAFSLYNKLGFKKEGVLRQAVFRHGRYHDYIVMSILKSEYDTLV